MPARRRVEWAKFRVSVVSTVAVLIFLTLAFLMTGGTLFHQESTIYLYVPDATGLDDGSPVTVDGIEIGSVVAVQFAPPGNPNRVVRLTLHIENGRLETITPDSHAEIGSDSLIGDKYVDITSGTAPGHLRPGGELRYRAPAELLKSVDVPQLEKQLREVDSVLSDIEAGRSALGQFIIGDQMYGDVLVRVQQIERAMRTAVTTTSSLGDALYTDRLYQRIRAPIAQLDRQLAVIQSGQGTAGALLRDNAEYESLMSTVGNLRQTISHLASSDFMRKDDMYAGWNRGVAGLIQSVDHFNATPLMETTDTYDSLNGMLRDLAKNLADFREHPQSYLRVKVF